MTRGRILHVDDDALAQEALHAWLERHGFTVLPAATIGAAEQVLAETEVDLVLCDIRMPGNERLEWTEQLLARNRVPLVVLLTGNPELETAMRAANLPIAAYLLKSPDYATLPNTLGRLIERRRQRVKLAELVRSFRHVRGQARINSGDSPAADPLAEQLDKVAVLIEQDGVSRQRDNGDPALRAALGDTIGVLAKTKHSFRSRELADLRARLEQLLAEKSGP